jgi:hypothetical protein
MRYLNIIATLVLTGFAINAAAQGCASDGYTDPLIADDIDTALTGMRVIATEGSSGDSPWHEDHCAGGALYKVGVSDTDPVDPRAFRGTWASVVMAPGVTQGASGCAPGQTGNHPAGGGPPVCLTPTGQAPDGVTYIYGGALSYTWTLWENPNPPGGLCWQGSGAVIATAPPPGSAPC